MKQKSMQYLPTTVYRDPKQQDGADYTYQTEATFLDSFSRRHIQLRQAIRAEKEHAKEEIFETFLKKNKVAQVNKERQLVTKRYNGVNILKIDKSQPINDYVDKNLSSSVHNFSVQPILMKSKKNQIQESRMQSLKQLNQVIGSYNRAKSESTPLRPVTKSQGLQSRISYGDLNELCEFKGQVKCFDFSNQLQRKFLDKWGFQTSK